MATPRDGGPQRDYASRQPRPNPGMQGTPDDAGARAEHAAGEAEKVRETADDLTPPSTAVRPQPFRVVAQQHLQAALLVGREADRDQRLALDLLRRAEALEDHAVANEIALHGRGGHRHHRTGAQVPGALQAGPEYLHRQLRIVRRAGGVARKLPYRRIAGRGFAAQVGEDFLEQVGVGRRQQAGTTADTLAAHGDDVAGLRMVELVELLVADPGGGDHVPAQLLDEDLMPVASQLGDHGGGKPFQRFREQFDHDQVPVSCRPRKRRHPYPDTPGPSQSEDIPAHT